MRAVAQRVSSARVEVAGDVVGRIEQGLLVYLGAGKDDADGVVAWMASKLANLRIFADDQDRMTRSVLDVGGGVLVVPQFTLYGDVRKGRRPSFDGAADPAPAQVRYGAVCDALAELGVRVERGRFRTNMEVHAVVQGPVTILIDSDRTF